MAFTIFPCFYNLSILLSLSHFTNVCTFYRPVMPKCSWEPTFLITAAWKKRKRKSSCAFWWNTELIFPSAWYEESSHSVLVISDTCPPSARLSRCFLLSPYTNSFLSKLENCWKLVEDCHICNGFFLRKELS
jgi:hypothetical protein